MLHRPMMKLQISGQSVTPEMTNSTLNTGLWQWEQAELDGLIAASA